MKKLLFELDGTKMRRHDFIYQTADRFDEFFEGTDAHANSVIMFFSEILKNIYDHAGGKGKLVLEEVEGGARFVVEDYGGGSYDLEALKERGSLKAGNGVNYGVGLSLIPGVAEGLGVVDFKLDCSCGFKYSGFLPYKTRS